MSKLYSPPTWNEVSVLKGALSTTMSACFATYLKTGVWHTVQTLQIGEADGADYLFTTPTVISDTLATTMQAANVPGTYV